MKLYIDDEEVKVTWCDNVSVSALKEIAPLTITTSRYGGFEQVGPIGQYIESDDTQMTTAPGDIVLYNSSNIVLFFRNEPVELHQTWPYRTRPKRAKKIVG